MRQQVLMQCQGGLLSFGKCKLVYYYGLECQAQHWCNRHKEVYKANIGFVTVELHSNKLLLGLVCTSTARIDHR
jgi:hypothetical protein